jgi:hypothetical protein
MDVKTVTDSPPVRAAIARLRSELAREPVFGRSDLRIVPAGDVPAIGVIVGGDRTGARALDAIRHLRSVDIPQAFGGTDANVSSGVTPRTTSTSSTP